MVLRKPTPQDSLVPRPLSQAANNPPYPTTPTTEQPPVLPSSSEPTALYSPDLATSPAFNLKTLSVAERDAKKQREDEVDEAESNYSDSEWDDSDDEDTSPEDIPNSLKIGGGKPIPTAPKTTQLPDALRAGPPPGYPVPKKSADSLQPDVTGGTASSYGAASNSSAASTPLKTNNPYLRMQTTGQSNFGGESSQQVWGDAAATQAEKYGELVELPAMQTPVTPTNGVANLSLNSKVPAHQGPKSPDQAPLIAVESATPSFPNTRHDSNASSAAFDPGMDISSLDAFSRNYGLPDISEQHATPQRSWQEQQEWEQSERERKQRELAAAHEAAVKAEQERHHEDEYHRIEQAAQFTPPSPFEEPAPALPPRTSQDQPASSSAPTQINTNVTSSRAEVDTPNTAMKKQTKEYYHIKHIRWYDANTQGIRTSPILTQNANGPCPLLALVNALVLSTPARTETALVETLRTREQVTLGLLLDAVFDELMSGRRGGAAQELPDVSELYTFLVTLHTGLNVNPMFVQDPGATDGPSLIPSLAVRPGGFENTREMRLYRTFNVPLVHGWLPEVGSEAYLAFERLARTYDEAQTIQFQEEELEAKLSASGLTPDEQTMFTDIHTIKEFLSRWPTQLTEYGLRTIRDTAKPGQVGILFRNDHFSTVCKDPRTEQIVTLVTDTGYSTHDEIVWESLVDVNGQGSELFSGDFRPVGNSGPSRPQQQQPVQSLLDIDDSQAWTTVTSRRRNQQPSAPTSNLSLGVQDAPPASPNTEQEDHDLALALQLQEEEDDRHRRSQEERRRRENELSEQAIASRNNGRAQNRRASRPGETPPAIPPRRNNVQTHRPNNDPAPPPTYEEAATSQPYHPPQGHPANPATPIQPQGSAYMSNSAGMPPGHLPNAGRRRNSRPLINQIPGRRQSAGAGASYGVNPDLEGRDKCIMM